MEGRQERLPELRDTIFAAGAHLKVTLNERDGWRDVEIVGNRAGLRALAAICSGLSDLTNEELLTPQTITTSMKTSGAPKEVRFR